MSTRASAILTGIQGLNSIALTDYEVSQGAPVSISNTGGIGSTTVGSIFTGNSGVIIIVALAVVALAFLGKRR